MEEINYELVDLGLPSGMLWMDRNIGASSPEDAGLYFAWGETQGYTADEIRETERFKWNEYKFGIYDNLTKYNETDGLTALEAIDDAVSQNVSGCNIPTDEQIIELLKETDVYCIKEDGTEISGTWSDDEEELTWNGGIGISEPLKGIEFRNKADNSVKIFIPCAGNSGEGFIYAIGLWCSLWSSSLDGDYTDYARYLDFNYCGGSCNGSRRYHGYPVRGVKNKEN